MMAIIQEWSQKNLFRQKQTCLFRQKQTCLFCRISFNEVD